MEEAARLLDEVAAEFGLTVNVVKTKLLAAGCNLEVVGLAHCISIDQLVEQVQSFQC